MKTNAKKKKSRGRPRKVGADAVALNVMLDRAVWMELRERAYNKGVSMAELARLALGEWLLACALNQRPITGRGT